MRLFRSFAGTLAIVASFASASPPVRADEPLALPQITVTDSQVLPKPEQWRYARVPGFEVLSTDSDSGTIRLVGELQRFQRALEVIWPAMASDPRIPGTILLCAKDGQFQTFTPVDTAHAEIATTSINLRDKEQEAIILDVSASVHNAATGSTLAAQANDLDPDGPQSDQSVNVDHDKELHREYLHFLFGRMSPRPPAWLEEGLAELLLEMRYTATTIEFAKLDDPKTFNTGEAFNTALVGGGLMPMDKMFAVHRNSDAAQDVIAGLWPKQCACFVHLCAFGYDGRYRAPFLQFITRAEREPVTETLFEQCFNMKYKDMLVSMRDYLDFTVYHAKVVQSKKGEPMPDLPAIALRDATQAEIGRIKGDALRLAGQAELARIALVAPYIRGERDPELLASLGMDEFASGRTDRARKFLEAAAKANSTRARTYVELAQLRMDAIARGKLTAYAVSDILTPLFRARRLGPPLPDVYETIAKAWDRSSIPPTLENLQVLDEGVNLFPTDSELIYRDALLKEQIGANAAPLIKLGRVTAADDATRERFAHLQAVEAAPKS